MKYFIGLDLGTQSSKGVLFSPDGNMISEATAQYIPDFPKPGWAEQDVHVWVEAMKEIVAKLLNSSNVSKDQIGMISFASQCGGIVPVGKDRNALDKCILWLDHRAEDQCDAIREKISDDEAFKLIGSPISASIGAMKILWLKNNKPKLYDEAVAFLEPGEYMVYYLTGRLISDFAHASITGLYDIANREWSDKMLGITGISKDKLLEIQPAVSVAGNILQQAAEHVGLNSETKVIVGTGDQHAALIGSGLVQPGNILNVMGTAEIIAAPSDHVAYDPNKILRPHLHVNPKLWQIEQGSLISGAAVRWFRDNVARVSFDEMNALAEKAPVGSDGLLFLSALNGATAPVFNGYARGIFFGMTMSHTLGHMTRAVYEGCAYGFRDNIESLKAMGLDKGDIIAGGGGVNSAVWMQLKADLIGKRIKTLKNSDSTPIGAGMLAGVAQGNFKNLQEASDRLVEFSTIYVPNEKNKKKYDDMYQFYRDMYFTVEPLFNKYK